MILLVISYREVVSLLNLPKLHVHVVCLYMLHIIHTYAGVALAKSTLTDT